MKALHWSGLSAGVLFVVAGAWQSHPAPVPLAPQSAPPVAVRVITSLPVLIDSPGRYVLAGGLSALPNPPKGVESGIVIRADHVELDLGGYSLVGAEGTSSGIRAVLPEKRDALLDVCVRNGSVSDWGGAGVDLGVVQGARLIELRAVRNGAPRAAANGLRVGQASLVRDCLSLYNTGQGIVADEGSRLEGCLSGHNGQDGFSLGPLVGVRGCGATRNGSAGFLAAFGCSLADCTSGSNLGEGVSALGSASVRDCAATSNGGSGVSAGRGSFVGDCLLTGNTRWGVVATGGQCRIEGNHLVLNGSSCQVADAGNAFVRNTIAGDVTDAVKAASTPGGVFLPDPSWTHLTMPGKGSLQMKPGADQAQLVEGDGLPAPWTNIALR